MSDIVDGILEHHGVKGMKWGSHKMANKGGSGGGSQKGFFNNPSAAKAILVGSYGKKSAYTNPKALEMRKQAGRLRVAGILGTVGASAIAAAGKGNVGAQAVSGVLNLGASGVLVASLIKGASGASIERASRG